MNSDSKVESKKEDSFLYKYEVYSKVESKYFDLKDTGNYILDTTIITK